jgi:hypothetical protein
MTGHHYGRQMLEAAAVDMGHPLNGRYYAALA